MQIRSINAGLLDKNPRLKSLYELKNSTSFEQGSWLELTTNGNTETNGASSVPLYVLSFVARVGRDNRTENSLGLTQYAMSNSCK